MRSSNGVSHRSLQAFYGFTALWSSNFTQGLWILYLVDCHWSLFQVGLAEAGFHAVSFLSEVPTGIFADRWGRRLSLHVGLGIGVVTPLAIFWLAPQSVFWGSLSVAFGSLSWTFIGGADRALLYNLVGNHPEQYRKVYSRVLAVSLTTTALAVVIGGWLAGHYGWGWPFMGSAATCLLAIGATFGISARPVPLAPGVRRSILATVGEAGSVLRTHRTLLIVVGFGAMVGTLVTTNHLYAQATLMQKGASVFGVGVIIALGHVVSAVGSLMGGRSGRVSVVRWLTVGTGLLGLLVGLIGVMPLGPAVASYIVSCGVDGSIDPAYEALLNRETPESHRAAILSMPGAGFSLGMILVFPLCGWALTNQAMALAYGLIGVALVGLGLFVRKIRTSEPEHAQRVSEM